MDLREEYILRAFHGLLSNSYYIKKIDQNRQDRIETIVEDSIKIVDELMKRKDK